MLDRFDIILDVAELKPHQMMGKADSETTRDVAARVAKAREAAIARAKGKGGVTINARLTPNVLDPDVILEKDARRLMEETLHQYNLSARAFHRVLRVASTIRDLAHPETDPAKARLITRPELAEALHYRTRYLFS